MGADNDLAPVVVTTLVCEEQSSARRDEMPIVKVIEIIAESPKSWDDAANQAVKEVSKTVDGIAEIWVSGMKAVVENNKIVRYRITASVSFVVKGRDKT